MVDKNNLNRIKGILRAQEGTEIPTYTVKLGDTLSKIIIEYNKNNNTNLNVNDVAAWSNITDPNKIQVGQTLNLAKPLELNSAPVDTNLQLEVEKEEEEEESAGMIYEDSKDWSKWKKGVNFASNIYNTIGNTVGASLLTTDSKLTKGLNSASKFIADGIEQMGPLGSYYGKMFKNLSIAGDVIQEMGGGTDQQTKMDKWMDSSFFSWNIGMLNGFKGENSDAFSVDNSTAERVGGAYGGALAQFNEAAEKANKKYGLFSSKAREKTNKLIAEAKRQQNIMGNIADEAELQRLNAASNNEQAILNNQIMFDGGYNLKYTYAAKHGGVLNQNISEQLEWEIPIELNWELPEFKEGGSIELQEELELIPELQSGNKIRTIEELIEYAKQKNPRFIQRLSEEPKGIKFVDNEGNEAEGSHYLASRGEYVVPRIQEINGELKFLSPQEAIERAMESGNYLEMTPEETILFAEKYKQGWPEFFKKFQKGGSVGDSDIPEFKEEEQYPKEYLQFKASLPDNQRNTPESEYDTYLGWKLYGKPKDFNAAKKIGMYAWDSSDNSWHGNSIAWDNTTGIGYFLKPKHHSTIGYELDWFNKCIVTEEGGKQREMTPEERKEWETFRSNYTLVDGGNFYKYVPKNKKGGSLGDSEIPEIEETTQKNVIPEGALHKNKHHMEHAEGLTKKGIPVIDEDGDLQAEIEHSEIIFTLEVTKKLEEYYNIFYSEDSSEKEKDQAATDAGKLLVYLILENTDDRTGLIESCKKGGQLIHHNNITKSDITTNLIKEVIKEALLELLIK